MVRKLDLYKIFVAVGQNNSFSSAAKELYMTQPAISQSIMQLEEELDTRLFNRLPKGVTLTHEGEILFEYANSALHLLGVGEEKIIEFNNLSAGELKIGVGDTIAKYFLLPYLETFHNSYPNIRLKIVNGTTLETIDLLKSGKVDLAICNLPIDDLTLKQELIIDIHDIFVCGEKFKRLISNPLTFEELTKLPLILLEPKSNSRKYIESFLLDQGVPIAPAFELGSHDLLLEFAKINLGIACVTKEFSRDYLDRGLLYEVPLREEIPTRNIGICYLKSVPLSPSSTKFVKILQNKQLGRNG